MFKHNLSAAAVTALLAVAGSVHAASPFPSAADEGYGLSVNAPLPAGSGAAALTGSTFPSAGQEGHEAGGAYAERSTPRNLENRYAGVLSSVFPSSGQEAVE
ncbi:MAG: hypothetical protein Q8L65_00565 [Burkholderiales bacterium]|nr:hypothetical protein [Burkholderiales bacterium]MDP2398155.1 hypothetical protein [Burkholderiales bacterium]